MKIRIIIGFFVLSAFVLTGCTSVISKEVRSEVDNSVGIQEVIENPDAFTGTQVLWAGIIIETKTYKDHTIIEVLQKPADYQGRPKDVDTSEGRFLAHYQGFLDPAVYSGGRETTIAGKIEGRKNAVIGEYAYTYPVVLITEIHLWPVQPDREYNYYYYPSYYHNRWQYW